MFFKVLCTERFIGGIALKTFSELLFFRMWEEHLKNLNKCLHCKEPFDQLKGPALLNIMVYYWHR